MTDLNHLSAEESAVPPGVVAVFSKDGRVIATANDFKRDTYGGFSLKDSQRLRATSFLARAVVREYCSHIISNALDTYDCESLVSKLKGETKFIYIGHGEANER